MEKKTLSEAIRFSALSLAMMFLATALAQGGTIAVLHEFGRGRDGVNPSSALIFDAAGNIYGETFQGGSGPCSGGCGTIFQLTPSGGGYAESVIYNFQGAAHGDGINPEGALIADTAGNLYGVTTSGGQNDRGTVFKLTPGSGGSWTESILYTFGTVSFDGFGPTGKLILDGSGNLYGVTNNGGTRGGGVVFQLVPTSSGPWTETVLHDFPPAGGLDGNEPIGIIFDGTGNIDGVTVFGGTKDVNGAGVVFQLVNQSGVWTENILHVFPTTGLSLQTPAGGLVFDTNGNLYMTMSRGGRGGAGVLELSPAGNGKYVSTPLFSFAAPLLPPQPYEGLVFDSASNLYSASYDGGRTDCASFGCGFIYRLSPGSPHWTAAQFSLTLHGGAGFEPIGGMTPDGQGNFYFASWGGGGPNGGVVSKVAP